MPYTERITIVRNELSCTHVSSGEGEFMYCNYCGKVIQDDANLCGYCGKRIGAVAARQHLMRVRSDRKIAGVCAGFAEYFDLDVTLVRVFWALLTVLSGFLPGLVAYIAGWIIMPEEPVVLAAPPAGQQITNP